MKILLNILFLLNLIKSFFDMKAIIIDCPFDSVENCALFISKHLKANVKVCAIIGLSFGITLTLSLKNIVYRWGGVLTSIFLIYIVFFYDTKVSQRHYGGGITTMVGIFSLLWFAAFSLLIALYECFKR